MRTAIAIMAFGFVVEKFDLFLRIAGTSMAARTVLGGNQLVGDLAGLLLIVLGGGMMVFAAIRFRQTAADIDAADCGAVPANAWISPWWRCAGAAGRRVVRLPRLHPDQPGLTAFLLESVFLRPPREPLFAQTLVDQASPQGGPRGRPRWA